MDHGIVGYETTRREPKGFYKGPMKLVPAELIVDESRRVVAHIVFRIT